MAAATNKASQKGEEARRAPLSSRKVRVGREWLALAASPRAGANLDPGCRLTLSRSATLSAEKKDTLAAGGQWREKGEPNAALPQFERRRWLPVQTSSPNGKGAAASCRSPSCPPPPLQNSNTPPWWTWIPRPCRAVPPTLPPPPPSAPPPAQAPPR